MRILGRPAILVPTALLFCICFVLYGLFSGLSSSPIKAQYAYGNTKLSSSSSSGLNFQNNNLFTQGEQKQLQKKPRYAITSSVQTSSFAAYALMLGYTIQKHNDLTAMDAELVLLVRVEGSDGVTAENITRLEKVGWNVRVAEDLVFKNVNNSEIRARHRHNLNKLHLWSWTEYEKILFIDADVVCKGSLKDIWQIPGDFAAAPDVWWNILTDNRFNSGVIVFRPSMEEFHKLIAKVSDPEYHSPNDADQAFLNVYYRFRYYGLPYKYNLNLIMYQYHRPHWDTLWDEAVLVHFTVGKPKWNPKHHCHKGCNEWEPVEWYAMIFKEMLAFYGWEKEVPAYA